MGLWPCYGCEIWVSISFWLYLVILFDTQQRKVADSGRAAEEGRATSLVYSSNFAAESDPPAEPRKRQQTQAVHQVSAPRRSVASDGHPDRYEI